MAASATSHDKLAITYRATAGYAAVPPRHRHLDRMFIRHALKPHCGIWVGVQSVG
jgi:hypothetical protein